MFHLCRYSFPSIVSVYFHHFDGILDQNNHSWQEIHGSISGIHSIIRSFQWKQWPDCSQRRLTLGQARVLQQLPDFIRENVHDIVFDVIRHEQVILLL
jgi:hypothetical protein